MRRGTFSLVGILLLCFIVNFYLGSVFVSIAVAVKCGAKVLLNASFWDLSRQDFSKRQLTVNATLLVKNIHCDGWLLVYSIEILIAQFSFFCVVCSLLLL